MCLAGYSQPSITRNLQDIRKLRVNEVYVHVNLLLNEGERRKLQLFYVLSRGWT